MAFVMSAPRSDVQYRMAEMLEKLDLELTTHQSIGLTQVGFQKQ